MDRPHHRRPLKPPKRTRGHAALTFIFTFLQPVTYVLMGNIKEQPLHAAYRKHPYLPPNATVTTPVPKSPSPASQLENVFIDAMVQACTCRKHIRASPAQTSISNPTHLYRKARRRHQHTGMHIRQFHGNPVPSLPSPVRSPLSREECMSMVDWYREPFSTQATFTDNEPPSGLPAPWDDVFPTPDLEETLSEVPLDLAGRSPLEPSEPSESGHRSRNDLQVVANLLDIIEDNDCTHEAAFEAYSTLPSPGVSFLSSRHIRLLFRRLSVLEKKDQDSMLRYLSVVDDMKSAELPMKQEEWNSAIAICGQKFPAIAASDIESALQIWKEMEQEAGVKSGNVTFNILFDMAAKAGKFVLAEMILKEMEVRKLEINRYARVSFIFYHGLRGDGDGVRRAYREFVEEGQIVDTVVMNCLIASLIRAGEPAAAGQVYGRMRNIFAKHTGQHLPLLNWKETRDLGRILDRSARLFRDQPVLLERIRDEQVLTPNLRTYTIFIEYHASKTGELRRIAALLTEMQQLGVPMHGRIFLNIFKGFAAHGGLRYTSWTKARLESVWNALLDVLDEKTDVKIMKWMVVWVVRAFQTCASRERTLEIWQELRRRWKPGGGEVEAAMEILRDILKGDNRI